MSFFCYCAAELTAGLWGSTYLVKYKGLTPEDGARWVSLYYLGITLGRLFSGFLAMKMNNRQMIRLGQGMCLLGTGFLLIPANQFQLAGFLVIGLGCAPIYPCMLHETPNRFGKELSQAVMGIQMAFAYVGSTFMPPLFGAAAGMAGLKIFPYFLMALILIMIVSSEQINLILKRV